MICKTPLAMIALLCFNAIGYCQASFVIPPGFEEVEGDLFTGGYPDGFHFQQLAVSDWFEGIPDGPQTIERISFRPKFSVTEPLDLPEAHLTLRLSTTTVQELGPTYGNNHGSDVKTVFDAPIGISSQAISSNGVTRDFDVHFDLMEPFVYDRSQGNLVFDFEYLPIAGMPIPDSLTDFTVANYAEVTGFSDTIHHVSNTGPSQPEANQALPGGNIYQVTFSQPSVSRQPIFTRKQDVGPINNLNAFEFVPTVSADGLTMFFSASESPSGVGGEDMYIATRPDLDSAFTNVMNLEQLNSTANDTVGSLSNDGRTLYFGSNRAGGNEWEIYSATRGGVESAFEDPQPLPGPVNTSSIENSPRVSADGLTLVYHVSDPALTRNREIWIASRESTEAEFGDPKRLDVNDSHGTFWPSLSSDGLVLVSSDQPSDEWPNQPGGEGAEDVYVAVRDSVDEPFSEPQNPDVVWPGSQINGADRTAYPYLSPDWPEIGSKLYFVEAPAGNGGLQASIYQMTWMIPEDGDINLDGWKDVTDLNDMCRNIRRSVPEMSFDINGDGAVTLSDMQLLQDQFEILAGDANLDGAVDFEDFLTLSTRFRRNATSANWARADFDCSGETDFADFLALAANFGQTFGSEQTVAVPEPSSTIMVVLAVLSLVSTRRRLSRRA